MAWVAAAAAWIAAGVAAAAAIGCGAAPSRPLHAAPPVSPAPGQPSLLAKLASGDHPSRTQRGDRAASPHAQAPPRLHRRPRWLSTSRFAKPLPRPYGRDYRPESVAVSGAIAGVITWRRPPVPLAKRAPGCGSAAAADTLAVDGRGRVAGAVVYLSDIHAGRRLFDNAGARGLQIGGLIERDHCGLAPHIQLVAPIGALLTVASTGAGGGSITATAWERSGSRLLFRLALGARGAERRRQLDHSGFIEIRASGDALDNAWLVVAPHPYYAITGAGGRFRIDQVPPGRYTLAVWHEPVVVGVDAAGERRIAGPFRAKRQVVVRAGRTTRQSLRLGR